MVYDGIAKLIPDPILTNISVGFDQGQFVGNALFPNINVANAAGRYWIFGKETWVQGDTDYRAPGAVANEITGLGAAQDSFLTSEHALQVAVPDEEKEQLKTPFNAMRDATELVTSKIMLGREVAIRDLVTTAANYASSNAITLSGTSQFSDYANSDPITVFKNAKLAIHAQTFMDPNLYVIPYEVMSVLEDHPKILERIKYTRDGILNEELIAKVLKLTGKVIVPGVAIGVQNSPEPMDVTASYMWGKDIVIAYVPSRPGQRTPAFGYEFTYQANNVVRWREEPRVSDVIRVRRNYALKLVGKETNPNDADYNKVIAGYLIKNAVA